MKLDALIIRRFIWVMATTAAMAAALWVVAPMGVSLPRGLLENPDASPVVLDRHGMALAHLTLPDDSRSSPLSWEQFPRDLMACTLAAEDKRFDRQGGVDFLATGRAIRDFFFKRRIVSGASTITQQLTKIHESLAAGRHPTDWGRMPQPVQNPPRKIEKSSRVWPLAGVSRHDGTQRRRQTRRRHAA